ncbi:MAG: DUF4373 domain-containing protein [Clostridia bacterium]|nr:DUF4373 domain-containing protein [Clostridia bacterium]
MFTLESRFGNDGYAFWFKTLEALGTQEDLCFRADNPADWLFLTAKTRVTEKTATEILNLLAALGAIDAELWEHKIIWSQNFVDRLSDVYVKRTAEIPQKPSFRPENYVKPDVSAPKSTQSKVKESKLNNITSLPAPQNAAPAVMSLILNDGTFYDVLQKDIDIWTKCYKAVDIMQELGKMAGWLDGNEKNRKTPRGIRRFITNWLSKAQDKAPKQGVGQSEREERRFTNVD